jgi:hypothetical protein
MLQLSGCCLKYTEQSILLRIERYQALLHLQASVHYDESAQYLMFKL